MKKFLLAAFLALLPGVALAQVTPAVLQLPVYLDNNVGNVKDLGNGPMEIKIVQGSAQLWTMQGSGTSQTVSASTSVTLNSSAAANPPCIGCNIQSLGAAPGATSLTVASFNGTTGIGLSAAVSIISGTTLQWGVACPTSVGANPVLNTQGGIINDLPFNTLSRICGASQFSTGGVILPFAIGAH